MKRRQLLTVGLTVIIAIFLLVRAIIFLHPSPGDGKQKIHVLFESVEKIAPGTRVAFAGKPIGEVSSVTLLPDIIDRSRESHQIFPYEVILSVDSSVNVYKTDDISVKTSGLMGERFIVITPKPFPKDSKGQLVLPTDILIALPTSGADQAIAEISSVAQKADATMEALTDLIKANQKNISQTTESFREAADSISSILKGLQERKFGEKLSLLTDKATSCAEEIELITKKLGRSIHDNGTIGRLFKDPKLYDSAILCINNLNQLMSDIDDYGIFFHTSRDWQREKLIRSDEKNITVGAKVRQDFSKIKDSILDISSTIEEAKTSIGKKDATHDSNFVREFTQHLKEIQKELATLHAEIENLEIGDLKEEGQQ